MQDFKAKLEKLIADAAECDLIANLSDDKDKREAFRSLAERYRKMADAVRQAMADRAA
jgi:hypothetical protein